MASLPFSIRTEIICMESCSQAQRKGVSSWKTSAFSKMFPPDDTPNEDCFTGFDGFDELLAPIYVIASHCVHDGVVDLIFSSCELPLPRDKV